MERLVLERLENGDQGTFGRLLGDTVGRSVLYTIERPWLDNQPNISCIPVGSYDCAWCWSRKLLRWTYLLADVPDRAGIRIHSANLSSQLNGCIAVGERRGWLDGRKAVLLSAPAVSSLATSLDYKPFRLEIIRVA